MKVKPAPDLSGIVSGHLTARHLSGALVRAAGVDVVVTARHLGPQSGQKVIIGGEAYTLGEVRGVDVGVTSAKPAGSWRDDLLLNGDLAVCRLVEEVPPHLARYLPAELASGKGHMLHASGKLSTFPFMRHENFRQWLRGSKWRPLQFQAGDSGRPILTVDRFGRTMISGVLSRQWWGEWLLLKSRNLM